VELDVGVMDSDQGVRFRVDDERRFAALQRVFHEIRTDKERGEDGFRPVSEWQTLVPEEVQRHFGWLTDEEFDRWQVERQDRPVAIYRPLSYLGASWDFAAIIGAVDDGEYALRTCDMTDAETAELIIETWSYPYGGIGCFIALVEGFRFRVLGVNECGEYEPVRA
jgi:hypothetical protein